MRQTGEGLVRCHVEELGDLMESLVASDAVGAGGDRFDWFRETVCNEVMPVMLSTRHAAGFRASITDLDLGVVRLTAVSNSPVLSRAPRLMSGVAIPSTCNWRS